MADLKAARSALSGDALTALVLWATSQEYNAETEALLSAWARHLALPESAVHDRIDAVSSGALAKPPPRPLGGAAAAARDAYAAALPGEVAAAGGGSKRASSAEPGSGEHAKRPKTMQVGLDAGAAAGPFAGLGPAVGRKVLRYWPRDAHRNRGDPWFEAVVTDWDGAKGMHKLTYFFGSAKEEYEDCNLEVMDSSSTQVLGERADLERLYADPKRRAKSQALAKSRWLQQHAGGGGGGKGGGGAKRPAGGGGFAGGLAGGLAGGGGGGGGGGGPPQRRSSTPPGSGGWGTPFGGL